MLSASSEGCGAPPPRSVPRAELHAYLADRERVRTLLWSIPLAVFSLVVTSYSLLYHVAPWRSYPVCVSVRACVGRVCERACVHGPRPTACVRARVDRAERTNDRRAQSGGGERSGSTRPPLCVRRAGRARRRRRRAQ